MIGNVSCLLAMFAVCIIASIAPNAHAAPPSAGEYQLKAVFLYNFVKFVDWPIESFADADEPIIIGILGNDPFGVIIDQTIKDKTVKGRKMIVKRSENIEDLGSPSARRGEEKEVCHILFISSSEERHLPTIIETLKDSSVLTVGEMRQFAQRGGMINFVIKENKISFEINVDAAERAKLKISSKLLKLAIIVRDKRHKEKAVFLYNFAKFVDWPIESFADADAPIIIGILGNDPFGAIIGQTIKDKTVKGRKMMVKRFENIEDLGSPSARRGEEKEVCHILFINSSEERHLPAIIETLKDSSILTVGEVKQFAQRGGIINFVIKENKIRFEINVDAAERAKLKTSSQLLRWATIVTDERHGEEN